MKKNAPQTPQPAKSTIMEKLKSFFVDPQGDTDYESVNVMNEASFHIPMS